MPTAYRGSILHCLRDPGESADGDACEYFADGVLVVANGHVVAVGDAATRLREYDDVPVVDCSGKLIIPGFVDCHVHFPQLDIVASYGSQLLEWLQRYAYPAEERLADRSLSAKLAERFIAELLQNGTTTALVFGTVHAHSADTLLQAAEQQGMRLIAGKVLMDTDCPPALQDTAESGYDDSKALIEKWHGRGRLGYAITPRFALTSTAEQLAAAGRLAAEYPDVWVHTHLAENPDEIEAVARRFPARSSYLDVYDSFGLVRERSVFAHCIHLSAEDRQTMAASGAAAAFCPSSNLFLGSGLFDLGTMRESGVRCGLGSDVGGGTSLSPLKTAADAYKTLQLQGQSLPPTRALWLATLGAAESLYLDDRIGNFEPGKEADFVVLDLQGGPSTAQRIAATETYEEALFALLMLGDERNIDATYVAGREIGS